MKLKQTKDIVLISLLMLSVTAITALAVDNTNTYNTTVMKSHPDPENTAPDLFAAFTASHHPYQPLTLRFNEESIGNPVPYRWGTKYGLMTYFWDFGDNTTCIEHNPEHQFKKPGTYRVYLKLENADRQVSKAILVINVEQ